MRYVSTSLQKDVHKPHSAACVRSAVYAHSTSLTHSLATRRHYVQPHMTYPNNSSQPTEHRGPLHRLNHLYSCPSLSTKCVNQYAPSALRPTAYQLSPLHPSHKGYNTHTDPQSHFLTLLESPRRVRRQALERGEHEFVHWFEGDRLGNASW